MSLIRVRIVVVHACLRLYSNLASRCICHLLTSQLLHLGWRCRRNKCAGGARVHPSPYPQYLIFVLPLEHNLRYLQVRTFIPSVATCQGNTEQLLSRRSRLFLQCSPAREQFRLCAYRRPSVVSGVILRPRALVSSQDNNLV